MRTMTACNVTTATIIVVVVLAVVLTSTILPIVTAFVAPISIPKPTMIQQHPSQIKSNRGIEMQRSLSRSPSSAAATTTIISAKCTTTTRNTVATTSNNNIDRRRRQQILLHEHSQRSQTTHLFNSIVDLDDGDGSSDENVGDSATNDVDPAGADTEGEAETVVVDQIVTSDGTTYDINVPKWKRILLFWKYNKNNSKDDDDGLTFRQRLAKAGISVVLSYGFVSNMSYCVSVSIAWYIFCTRTQLSPLAPGQWKPFLAVYSGFWVFNNIVRPIRFTVSVALSTQFDKVVAWIQNKTKLNKGAAIGLVVFLANVVGTTTIMCAGIAFAAALAGVPIRPPA